MMNIRAISADLYTFVRKNSICLGLSVVIAAAGLYVNSSPDLLRWLRMSFSSNSISLGSTTIALGKKFFSFPPESRESPQIVGGFYRDEPLFPMDSILIVSSPDHFDLNTPEGAAQKCKESPCTPFKVKLVSETKCIETYYAQGFSAPSQVQNVWCVFPNAKLSVSYHGAYEHYVFFSDQFEKLVNAARAEELRSLSAK